jgi:hypothetical protein
MAMMMAGAILASTAWAQVPGEKSVDGVVVSVGVASLEQIEALPAGRPERAMHASHAGNERDHLVVALADRRTGRSIQRAEVTATVSRLGMGESHHALERMDEFGTTSWGGYFDMREGGPYMIRLEIARPGRPAPIVADFVYRTQ